MHPFHLNFFINVYAISTLYLKNMTCNICYWSKALVSLSCWLCEWIGWPNLHK